jgi:quinol-cytochrome oxidoreductase complex cytochrome b subunit
MGQPTYPAVRPPKPPVSGGDVAISIAALILTGLMVGVAAVFGLFSLAFLDHCPPESCSAEGAASAVVTALSVAFVIGVVGLVVTIVQLVRRKRGWPFAVATLVLCAIAIFFGGVGYSIAVG